MKHSEVKKGRLPVFKERFGELRKGRSNTEFADFLGMSRQTVGFYLNGDRIPDALVLKEIAEKCDVSVDWLLGLSETKSQDIDIQRICKKTGLSENAIILLMTLNEETWHEIGNKQGKQIEALNDLLESLDILSLLIQLSNLKALKQTSKEIIKLIEESIDEVQSDFENTSPKTVTKLKDSASSRLFALERDLKYSRFEVIDTFISLVDEIYTPIDWEQHHEKCRTNTIFEHLAEYARTKEQYDFADFIEGIGQYSETNK